jgi:predicted acylesterase/phospholipase RssA
MEENGKLTEKANGKWMPKVLILGPGGVKGFLTIGSLLFFEKSKLLKEINKVVGISIGAVIGMFYTAGFSITDILEIALSTQIADVMTSLDIVNVMKKNGLISHDIIRKKMEEKLIQKYGFVPTLKQFYMMTGIEFDVVVTNLDDDKAEYFNHETEPELSCVEAVLMSMSLPLFFQSYVYKNKYYLDGGIADPFPIDRYKNEKVLGVFLKGSPKDSRGSFFHYLSRVVQSITSVQIKNIKIPPGCKIINLEHDVNDTIGVKMSFEQRVEMVLTGYVKGYEFYQVLHQSNKKEYPMFITRYHSLQLFHSLQKDKKHRIIYQYESEINSDEMEEEGDFYLEDCFEEQSEEESEEEEYGQESEEEEPSEQQSEGLREEGEPSEYQSEGEYEDQNKEEEKKLEEQKNMENKEEEKDVPIQMLENVFEIQKQLDVLVEIDKQIEKITSPKKSKYVLVDENEPLEFIDYSEKEREKERKEECEEKSEKEESEKEESEKEEREEEVKQEEEKQKEEKQKEEIQEEERKESLENSNIISLPIEQPIIYSSRSRSSEKRKEQQKDKEQPFQYHQNKKKIKKNKKKKHQKPSWINK